MRIILIHQRQFWHKCTCKLNVCIFYLRFALGIIHDDGLTEKHQKQLFYSSKTPFFRSLNLVTPLLFEEMLILTHINVSYNNQTGFLSKIVLLWVTCWHKSIKTLKHLIIDTSYSLGSSDVITNVNTMTPINTLFFYENKRRIHSCLKWNYKRSVLITS